MGKIFGASIKTDADTTRVNVRNQKHSGEYPVTILVRSLLSPLAKRRPSTTSSPLHPICIICSSIHQETQRPIPWISVRSAMCGLPSVHYVLRVLISPIASTHYISPSGRKSVFEATAVSKRGRGKVIVTPAPSRD
ncbi:hypothetical protein J6590_099078 [Homalodisca vitripennis]|nr:hypothetical protein J6590_099078 [Homalodisca vitripennis]